MLKKLSTKIGLTRTLFALILLAGLLNFLPATRAAADDLCGTQASTGVQLQEDPQSHICLPAPSNSNGIAGARSVNELILRVINVLLAIAAVIAVLYLVIGGYRYVTSAGSEKAAGEARKIITNAIIGLIVIILAYAIVSIVNNVVNNCGGALSNLGILVGC